MDKDARDDLIPYPILTIHEWWSDGDMSDYESGHGETKQNDGRWSSSGLCIVAWGCGFFDGAGVRMVSFR
jgi:hypothetical protein